MYIKFFTEKTFDNRSFAEILREKINVRAVAVADGILMDYGAFALVPAKVMPHWVYINREHIKSKLRTRPCTPDEVDILQNKQRYELHIYCGETFMPLCWSDEPDGFMSDMDMYRKNGIVAVVIDTHTGEALGTSF